MNLPIVTILTLALTWSTLSTSVVAQPDLHNDTAAVHATILRLDELFWHSYNACNADSMKLFFADDMEFYHDKGGPTLGLHKFDESIRTGMCGNTHNWQLRREAVAGTVTFFPMFRNGDLYGAILEGEHVFYVHEADKKEYLDGHARFSHLWLNNGGAWKMARVLSYDHKAADYVSTAKVMTLPTSRLKRLGGTYNSPTAGAMVVTPEAKGIKITSTKFQVIAYPETANLFFLRNRDLQFEFVEENKQITKVIVHERGAKVEEAPRVR
jgi:hypothetical protein